MKNLLFSCAAALFSAAAAAAEYHVAPQGNDANPGTATRPFASLAQARDAARHSAGPDAIVVHGGTYTLTTPLVLEPQDSNLVIRAAPGETPIITSARAITGWKPADPATPGLAETAKGKVLAADIPKGWRFHFLYANGKPMPMARMNKSDNFHDWPLVTKIGPVEPAGQCLGVTPGTLDDLPDNGDVEMNLLPVQWWNSLSVVRSFDRTASTLRRHSKNPTVCDYKDRFIAGGGRYNLQNAVKFITRPGEWAVDSLQGKVYFWPESGTPEALAMMAPAAYRLLELQGDGLGKALVRNVEIRGITFTCTDRLPEDQWPDAWVKRQAELPDGMLAIEGAEGCVVDSCTFTFSGSYAIAFQNYAQKNQVTRNEMGWLGCGGVLLQGFGPGTTDVSKNNLIQRNYIHHTGNGGYMHSAAVTLYQSNSNEISLNWLDNLPYAAIQIAGCHTKEFGPGRECKVWDSYGNNEAMYKPRWNELPQGKDTVFTRASIKPFLLSGNNRIADNIITNYMAKLGDGGALYCWGCGLGNVWQGNLLRRDKTRPGEDLCIALYMDDEVDGAIVKNNLCWHIGRPTINKGANTWENNLIQPTQPDGYEQRQLEIAAAATRAGGWLRMPQEAGLAEVAVLGKEVFYDETKIAIVSRLTGTIHYTTDGSAPTAKSPVYTEPFSLRQSAIVKALVTDGAGTPLAVTAFKKLTKMEPKPLRAGDWVKADAVLELKGPRLDDKKQFIGWIENGSHAAFGPYAIAPGDVAAMEIEAGVDPHFSGGKIHVRLDAPDGPEIAMVTLQSTGGFEAFKILSLPVKDLAGEHRLYFVFEGGYAICSFKAFRLIAK